MNEMIDITQLPELPTWPQAWDNMVFTSLQWLSVDIIQLFKTISTQTLIFISMPLMHLTFHLIVDETNLWW